MIFTYHYSSPELLIKITPNLLIHHLTNNVLAFFKVLAEEERRAQEELERKLAEEEAERQRIAEEKRRAEEEKRREEEAKRLTEEMVCNSNYKLQYNIV